MTTKFLAAVLVTVAAIFASSPAEARRHFSSPFVQEFCGDRYCAMGNPNVPAFRAPSYREPYYRRAAHRHHRLVKSHRTARTQRAIPMPRPAARSPGNEALSRETRIVEHPQGCPRTAFCGCGAALKVFGKNVRELWLAANWFRFPRSEPAPMRVAVRRHHVFVILRVLGRGLVVAYDANSGGHRTRIHVRSLAGYSVRDPGGRRYASAAH